MNIATIHNILKQINLLLPMRNSIQLIEKPGYVVIRLGFLPFALKQACDICAPLLDLFTTYKGEIVESKGPYSNCTTFTLRVILDDSRPLTICYHVDQS